MYVKGYVSPENVSFLFKQLFGEYLKYTKVVIRFYSKVHFPFVKALQNSIDLFEPCSNWCDIIVFALLPSSRLSIWIKIKGKIKAMFVSLACILVQITSLAFRGIRWWVT